MAQLPEDQRTPIRQEGFDTARAGATKVLSGALITLARARAKSGVVPL